MKFRNCFVIAVLLMVTCPALAYAEQNAADPNEPIDYHKPDKDGAYSWLPWWVSRLEFRLLWGTSNIGINNLPDQVRHVNEYNSITSYTLPDHTGGTIGAVTTLGLGFSLVDLNWLEFALDFSFRANNYTVGRSTRSEIGFLSDDYIGYNYGGFSIDPAIKIVPISYSLGGFEAFQAYFRIGLQKHFDTLSSGTDAWNQFTAQNRLEINGFSHIIGFGFDVLVFNWEYQRIVSYFSQPKMVESVHLFGVTFSTVAKRWCTRFHISRWFCGFT